MTIDCEYVGVKQIFDRVGRKRFYMWISVGLLRPRRSRDKGHHLVLTEAEIVEAEKIVERGRAELAFVSASRVGRRRLVDIARAGRGPK